jgi:hypothetical protein
LGVASLTVPVTAATPIGGRPVRFPLTPELALTSVDFPDAFDQGGAPEIHAGWLTLAAPSRAYRARWTLSPLEAGGEVVSQVFDLAPGASTLEWPAGAYILGRARFGTGFDVEVGATFGSVLKLWGYSAERADERLALTLVWGALAEPGADYKYFVHLFNRADESVPRQVDAVPLDFGYPTVLWLPGEVVPDTVVLPLDGLPPGAYGVAVGWYDPRSPALPRLPAFDASGQPVPNGRVVLPLEVTIP